MLMFNRIVKLVRLRFGLPFARRADRARARGDWIDAVIDYRRAVERMPWRQDLHVQIGNCLKEFGDYRGAIQAYSAVTSGPSLSEAVKQTADANRRAGTIFLPFAIAESSDAVGQTNADLDIPDVTDRLLPNRIRLDTLNSREWLGSLGQDQHFGSRLRGASYASVKLDQVGTLIVSRDGRQEPLLAGVIAIRGRITALSPLAAAEVRIGEGTGAFSDRIALQPLPGIGPLRLYVFNHWIDSARLARGHHWLSVSAPGKIAPQGLFVNVGAIAAHETFATSNSYVPAPLSYGDDLDGSVIAAPALARPAARSVFDRPITSVLALRVDQLGDVAASLAGLARLRAIFPEAHLTVLAQASVRAVIVASGICDEVLTIALDYDPASGRRSLPQAEMLRLRTLLVPRAFDLAIDMSPGDESRPLLLLTGALYLVGFNPDRFTYLDFGIGVRTRDKVNQLDKLSHGASVMMLVEALAIATSPRRPCVVRAHSGESLNDVGLTPQRYVVLHMGARHAINRWPTEHFAGLCERLIMDTDYNIVVFADGAAKDLFLEDSARIRWFDIVEPDRFDVIVSNAKVLVGNDSGPKHLAAARGVPTVSVHVDRLNWNEWGQDGIGTIVSKRVPCTGCGLNDIDLCGRDAVCVRSITVEEVFMAVRDYL